jgi:hypothetical protein
MYFSMASLSCVDGKDHSLPRLLDLLPPGQGSPTGNPPVLFSGILRLIMRCAGLLRS